MMAGTPPFAEGTLPERIIKHAEAEPPDIQQFNPRVTRGLVVILQRMLAKKPDARYQTAGELIKDLSWEMTGLVPQSTAGPSAQGTQRGRTEPFQDTAHLLATPGTGGPGAGPSAARNDTPLGGVRAAEQSAQQRSAMTQFERASHFLATGNHNTAIAVLRTCCRLDPANIQFRQTLRQAQQAKEAAAPTSGWLGRLTALPDRLRLRLARRAGNAARVLDCGEQIVGRFPGDLTTHILMAEAAEKLALPDLAEWLLKEAVARDKSKVTINRALARFYERQDDVKRAISYWQAICKVASDDLEAHRKVKDLLARATIARGRYENQLARRRGGNPRKQKDED
jgi:hypothetical protein